MTAKKKARTREAIVARVNGRELPLRNHAERALSEFQTVSSAAAISTSGCDTFQ